MPAWPGNKRLPGLVSHYEKGKELACLGTHEKLAEWLERGQGPFAGLDGAWDLLLGDQAC